MLDVDFVFGCGLGVAWVGWETERKKKNRQAGYLIKGEKLLSVRAVTSPPALGTPKECLGLKHDHTSLQT